LNHRVNNTAGLFQSIVPFYNMLTKYYLNRMPW